MARFACARGSETSIARSSRSITSSRSRRASAGSVSRIAQPNVLATIEMTDGFLERVASARASRIAAMADSGSSR